MFKKPWHREESLAVGACWLWFAAAADGRAPKPAEKAALGPSCGGSVSVVYLGATSEYIVFSASSGCILSVFSTYSNSRIGYIVFEVYLACILLYLDRIQKYNVF